MKLYRQIAQVFFSILLFSCSTNVEQHDWNKEAVKVQITQVFNEYVTQVNESGLTGVEAYFHNDSAFYWVEDGTLQYPNYDSLVRGMQTFSPMVKSVHLNILDSKVDVIDESSGMLYAEYEQALKLTSGYDFTLNGAMTILIMKKNGNWKFMTGHSSIKKPRGEN